MYALVVAVTLAQLISGPGRHHDDPAVLESIAEQHPLPAAFGPARITAGRVRLRDTYRDLEPELLARYVARQIDDLLDAGRDGEARALFELLPEEARAYLGESARRLDEVAALAKLPRDDRDLFELVVETLKEPPAGAKARLLAARFERNGYPSIAADLLRREVWRWEGLEDDSSPDDVALNAPLRTIVLSPAERALYEKKFGVFEPKVIRTWAVDRSGSRAVVQFETLFRLETLVLRKGAYGWFITDHAWSRG